MDTPKNNFNLISKNEYGGQRQAGALWAVLCKSTVAKMLMRLGKD